MSEIQTNYEKQIIHFLLKDKRYIEQVFSIQKMPIDYFKDEDNKRLVTIIDDNFNRHGSTLVQNELSIHLNALRSNKKIKDKDIHNMDSLFEECKYSIRLDDEQFDRIFESWVSSEITPIAKEIITSAMRHFNENRGSEGIYEIITNFERIKQKDKTFSFVSKLDLIRDIERQIEDGKNRRENPEKYTGIKSGIKVFDELFVGFEEGTLSGICGVVNTGKSTLMLNFSRNQYLMGKKILIISLEMPELQWARKYNSIDFQLDYMDMLRGNKKGISEERFIEYEEGLVKRKEEQGEGEYKILHIPAETYTWQNILMEFDKQFVNFRPDIIYVDQMSLINLGRYSNKPRQDALGDVAREMRAFAQTTKIPVVLALQANRASIVRNKKGEREIDINIENIEDSNKIGAHLDNLIALAPLDKDKMVLKTAKSRDGSKNSVIIRAQMEICTLTDLLDIDPTVNMSEKLEDLFTGGEEYDEEIEGLLKGVEAGIEEIVGSEKTEETTPKDDILQAVEETIEEEVVLPEISNEDLEGSLPEDYVLETESNKDKFLDFENSMKKGKK